MKSYREKEKVIHTIVFKDGVKVEDIKEAMKKSDKQHGLIVKMIPSMKFLGNDAVVDPDIIKEWILKNSHFFTDRNTTEFTVMQGFKEISHEVFKKKDPIGLIDDIMGDTIVIKPIMLTGSSDFSEEVINLDPSIKSDKVTKNRHADYGLMFGYDTDIDSVYDSYCNFTNTVSGGVHEETAEKAFCSYIQKQCKDSLSDKEKEKIDILWNDIRSGLKLVVYVNTNASVEFEGNVKEKIKSEKLKEILSDAFPKLISEYFEKNPEKLKTIVKLIKTNAKARIEANKVRAATVKENISPFKENLIKGYDRATNNGKNDYREIFFVEGDSARGGAGDYRDPRFQAFLSFRGVTANPHKQSMVELMDPNKGNKEWRNAVQILGCGWGNSFDINKLRFNKIIFLTDGDIDGYGIAAGMADFFMMCLPEIVKAGKLYRALPPLYLIKENEKKTYVHSKVELVERYQKKVIKSYNVALVSENPKENIDNETFKNLLVDTVDYASDLVSLANHFKANKFLIERVFAFLVSEYPNIDASFDTTAIFKDQKFISKFMSIIQQKFPETEYLWNPHTGCPILRSIVDKKRASLEIDSNFLNKAIVLKDTLMKYGYSLIVSEGDNKPEQVSIGQFCDMYRKYVPVIIERYKGLGEMPPEELYKTTLDPNTRTLIRLTTDDLKKDIKVFNKLFGTSIKDKLARAKMMSEYKIRYDDLDN